MGHADVQTTMKYMHHRSRAGDARLLSAAFEPKPRRKAQGRSKPSRHADAQDDDGVSRHRRTSPRHNRSRQPPLARTVATRHNGTVARRPTTLYLDDEILEAARALAARTECDESDVVEDAVRSYLGLDVAQAVWQRSDLSEEQALKLADDEKHAARR